MSKIYSPKIVTDSLVMCLDASQNKSYPTIDLPIKSGLALWLDASDDSTFSYSSGTSVSQWRDKSGNNRHFFQATAGNQPLRSAIINSRKTIQFAAASSQYLRYNSTIINNRTGGSVFVVWKTAGETSQYSQILDNYHGGANAQYAGFQMERNSTADQYYWGFQDTGYVAAGNIPATSYSNGTTYCYWITKDSTSITGGYNGISVTPSSSPSSTWTEDTKGWLIGCWGSNTETFGRFFNGQISEIIIFNRGLSAIEAKQVNTYLGQKWGILNADRNIIDLSGLEDNGLFGAGTTAYMPAFDYYNNGSLRFDGTDDYVDLGTGSNLVNLTNNITVEAWIKIPVSTNRYTIYGNGYTGTGMMFGTSANTPGGLEVYYPGIYVAYSTAGVLQPNVWQHVAYTRSGSGLNTHAFYINGVSQTVTQTVNGADSWGTSGTNRYLGLRSGVMFNGQMSSVKVYSKGLSAAEILQNYQAQKSKFDNTIVQQGLVLNLDAANPYSYAGAGTTWYDVSGAVNDFTIVNSPTYSVDQFTLNGSTQYFSISTGSGFFISSTNNFYADVGYAWSISIWFKFPVSPTTVRNSTINGGNCSYSMIGNAGGIGGAETLSLFVSGGDSSTSAGGLAPYYCVVGVRGSKTQLSAGSVNTNTWNHVVVTWNGSAGRGYFNGVDKGALNIGANAMQVSGYTVGATAGGASSHVFEGSLSQVFVYNRAISATEVLQNYNATKSRFGL